MKRFIFLVCFLLLIPSETAAYDISLVGDSHMQALGPRIRSSLEAQGHSVTVIARAGWSARRYRQRGDLPSLVGTPDLVLVVLGGNNRMRTLESYEQDVDWILSSVNAPVIWIGPARSTLPRLVPYRNRTSKLQASILQGRAVWIDSRVETAEFRLADGAHFTRSGYDSWSLLLLDRLQRHIQNL